MDRTSLARTVDSVLEQDFPEAESEVIVVNDSGRPLAKAPWQAADRVRILETQRRNRCFARNAGAAVARGRYLHFLDDDDWLLPGALSAFWTVAQSTPAAWIYGTMHFLDGNEQLLAEHHVGVSGNGFLQAVVGEWIPLQGSIIENEAFIAVGGFDQRFLMVEDKDLCRKITLEWDMACTSVPVASLVRERQRTTTNYRMTMKNNTLSRDDILARKGAFARMRGSVPNAYWSGKIVRAYLTCVSCNLKEGNLLNAYGRGLRALAGLILAGPRVFHPAFWRAIARQHSRPNIY